MCVTLLALLKGSPVNQDWGGQQLGKEGHGITVISPLSLPPSWSKWGTVSFVARSRVGGGCHCPSSPAALKAGRQRGGLLAGATGGSCWRGETVAASARPWSGQEGREGQGFRTCSGCDQASWLIREGILWSTGRQEDATQQRSLPTKTSQLQRGSQAVAAGNGVLSGSGEGIFRKGWYAFQEGGCPSLPPWLWACSKGAVFQI